MQFRHSPAACVFEVKPLPFIVFMFENNKATIAYSYSPCSVWQREKKYLEFDLSEQVNQLLKSDIKWLLNMMLVVKK